MISRKAKNLSADRERLQPLTSAELTQVSGGWCGPGPGPGPFGHHRRRHHKHHHKYHFFFNNNNFGNNFCSGPPV